MLYLFPVLSVRSHSSPTSIFSSVAKTLRVYDIFMDFQLKVFKSLNCSQCSLPFSDSLESLPRKFPSCGLTVCTRCLEDIKRQTQTQQPQNQTHGCAYDSLIECLFNPTKPAYFLMDLLNSPVIVELPDGNGYYLTTKEFDIPECVICHEECLMDRKPCDLWCNHTICFGCLQKQSDRSVPYYFPAHPTVPCYNHFISCPICNVGSIAFEPSNPWRTNLLIEFLKELPEMTKQLEMIKEQKGRRQLGSRRVDQINTEKTATTFSPTIEITDRFDCPECVKEFPIKEMFLCSDCSKKICGSCVVRQHREHKLTDLFFEETRRISGETKQMVSVQITGYKRIFPELHQQLVEKITAFENVLGEKVEGIAKVESLEKAKDEFDACKWVLKSSEADIQKKLGDYGDRFERISEDYLPNLRLFDTNLQNLIDELKEAKLSEMKPEIEKK